ELNPTPITVADTQHPTYQELFTMTAYNSTDPTVKVVEVYDSVVYRVSNAGVFILNHQQVEEMVDQVELNSPGNQPSDIKFTRRAIKSTDSVTATDANHWTNTIDFTNTTVQTADTATATVTPTSTP